jgi:catechol 2,3-dioxygenase-like lactoylglutathione lyase family enzyme
MSSAHVSRQAATEVAGTKAMDMKLEVVVLPVSDVDRAKQFYASLDWRLDADITLAEDYRVIQMTPPGSPAAVIFGTGVTSAAPGSVDSLVLVVDNIEATRGALIARGVEVSEVFHDETGVFHHAGTNGRVPRDPDDAARPPTAAPTARGRRSATPAATAGCCRRSPPACPDG